MFVPFSRNSIALQGARDTRSHRSFRYTGRVQVQLLDAEPRGFFYSGTYLGARRVVAAGAAFDRQDEYAAYDADAFVDLPLGPNAITSQVSYQRLDGDTTFTTLPKQSVVLFEVGYLIRAVRITPVFQFTNRDVLDTTEHQGGLGPHRSARVAGAESVHDPTATVLLLG